ncbi:hypothetical protein ACFLTT_01615 [Chloroflexota bacterium]
MELAKTITTIALVIISIIGAIFSVLALKKIKEDKSGESKDRVYFKNGLILLAIGLIWIGSALVWDISFAPGGAFTGVGVTYLIFALAYRKNGESK